MGGLFFITTTKFFYALRRALFLLFAHKASSIQRYRWQYFFLKQQQTNKTKIYKILKFSLIFCCCFVRKRKYILSMKLLWTRKTLNCIPAANKLQSYIISIGINIQHTWIFFEREFQNNGFWAVLIIASTMNIFIINFFFQNWKIKIL